MSIESIEPNQPIEPTLHVTQDGAGNLNQTQQKTDSCRALTFSSSPPSSSPPAPQASSQFSSPSTTKTAAFVLPRINIHSAVQSSLGNMLDTYRLKFWDFLKINSQKPEVRNRETVLVKPLKLLKDVFLSIPNRAFLDQYITRDSAVGANKDPQLQQRFARFHDELIALKDSLAEIGIGGLVPGKSINFWSGREGQSRAAAEDSFSDSDIPLFKFLFDCWGHMCTQAPQEHEGVTRELISLLPVLFSAMFATYAHGEVHVYMSSKNDGNSTVINTDSAFWSAELYALINNPSVSHIHLHLHTGKDPITQQDQWSAPIDLKSKDPSVIAYRDQVICLSRRGDANLKVPVDSLKKTINTWRTQAQSRGLIKNSPPPSNSI